MLVQIATDLAGDEHRLKAVQLPINLALPEALRLPTQSVGGHAMSALEAAGELGLTVVGSAALMQGQLTKGLPDVLSQHFPQARTDAQRALEFARTVPGVTTALVGMKNSAHVDENMEVVLGR
jgi:predicted aldo/keto reductase-like oxidoreductase